MPSEHLDNFLRFSREIVNAPPVDLPEHLAPCDGVRGMSSPANLALINCAVTAYAPCRYLEMGCYHGLSALAAMAGNEDCEFHLVEDFSQEERYGAYQDALKQNLMNRGNGRATLHPMDCFLFPSKNQTAPFDVFYYDAGHTLHETYAALGMFRHLLADEAIVFIDDTNWSVVRDAVLHARHDFGYEILYDLWTPVNGHWTFWNGFMVLLWRRS